MPNSALVYGLQDMRAYDGLGVAWYTDLLDAALAWAPGAPAARAARRRFARPRSARRPLPAGAAGFARRCRRTGTRVAGTTAPLYRNRREQPRAASSTATSSPPATTPAAGCATARSTCGATCCSTPMPAPPSARARGQRRRRRHGAHRRPTSTSASRSTRTRRAAAAGADRHLVPGLARGRRRDAGDDRARQRRLPRRRRCRPAAIGGLRVRAGVVPDRRGDLRRRAAAHRGVEPARTATPVRRAGLPGPAGDAPASGARSACGARPSRDRAPAGARTARAPAAAADRRPDWCARGGAST